MSSDLEAIFRRKLFTFFHKWKGFILQRDPVSVPNMLILLQYLGFKKPLDYPSAENVLTIRVQCSHHNENIYHLEMPIKPDQCKCMKTDTKESGPSTSSLFHDVWNTKKVYPLRPCDQQLEAHLRSVIETLIEKIIRLTNSTEQADDILGKPADVTWALHTLRVKEKSQPLSEQSNMGTLSPEALAQMSGFIEQAFSYLDISLSMFPEHLRNVEKRQSQVGKEDKRKSPLKNLVRREKTPSDSPTRSLSPDRSESPTTPVPQRRLFSTSSTSQSESSTAESDFETSTRRRKEKLFASIKRKFKS